MILTTVIAFGVLITIVILTSTVVKIPAPFGMALSAIAAVLIAGGGFPVTRMIEGTYGFFYIVLVFACGLILVQVMQELGFNETICSFLMSRFGNHRAILSLSLMLLLMIPGMLTGIGSVAVVSTGPIVAAVLMGIGVPRPWTAVFIIVGSILGMVAPPVNLPLMYMGVLIALPYQSYTGILLLLTVPLAIAFALWIGLHFGRNAPPEEFPQVVAGRKIEARSSYVYLPIAVVILLLVCERAVPGWPALSLPLILMAGALVGLPKLGCNRFFKLSCEALRGQAFVILMILLAAGVKNEFLSISGVRGLLATFFFAVIPAWLFLPSLLGLPLLGAFGTAFGATFILGYPFVLAMLPKSSIITSAALSMIVAVSDIMPPTALSGNLAANLVGETKYRGIFARSLLPAACMIAVAILAIVFADPLSRVFG
jgi:gluconate:H+ symporter, GntP family